MEGEDKPAFTEEDSEALVRELMKSIGYLPSPSTSESAQARTSDKSVETKKKVDDVPPHPPHNPVPTKVPAPEDRCTRTDRFVAPTVLIGALLIGVWFMLRTVQGVTLRDKYKPWLQLTVWAHLAVGLYLATMRLMPRDTAATLGMTVFGISLFVMVGRLILMNVPPKSSGEVVSDMFTHFVVPAAIAFCFFTGQVPRVSTGKRRSAALRASMYALGFLATWIVVNTLSQYARNGKWVYGSIANPKTHSGRKQLATVFMAAVACVMMASAFEFIRPKQAFACAPVWPTQVPSLDGKDVAP